MLVRLDFEQLLAVIAALPARPADRSGFLAIDGQGGAGKSTLAKRIAAAVPDSRFGNAYRGERAVGPDRLGTYPTGRPAGPGRRAGRRNDARALDGRRMPHEDTYVAEQNPEFRADVVIDGL